jgi:hypothetical protein
MLTAGPPGAFRCPGGPSIPESKIMYQENEKQASWPARLFFTAITIFMISAVFYFFLGAKDPAFYWNPATSNTHKVIFDEIKPGDRVVFTKDQSAIIRKTEFVYRGVKMGRIQIDATLLDLDSEYAYVHQFLPSEVKAPINIGGQELRLISWNRARISFEFIR